MNRKAISSLTKLLLIASCGGYCCNPECNKKVLYDNQGDIFWIGEHAHISAYEPEGPRGLIDKPYDNDHNNLIILCSSCHTLVDKYPERFSINLLFDWKRIRNDSIERGILNPLPQSSLPYTASLQYRYEQVVYLGNFFREEELPLLLNSLSDAYELILNGIRTPNIIQIIPDDDIESSVFEKIVLTLLMTLQKSLNETIYLAYMENYLGIINDLKERTVKGKLVFVEDQDCLKSFITLPINPEFQSRIIFVSDNEVPGTIRIHINKRNIIPLIPILGSR